MYGTQDGLLLKFIYEKKNILLIILGDIFWVPIAVYHYHFGS